MAPIQIESISLFQGLSNVELAKVLGKLEKEALRTDEILFRYGDAGNSMYIILKGQIALYIENENKERHALTVLGVGETLGEMALLTGEPRSATAVAATDSEVYILTAENFREFIDQYPTMSAHFIRLLSSRLTQTNSKLTKTREAELIRIKELVSKLPEQLQVVLTSAAVLPYGDVDFLSVHFKLENIQEWLQQFAETSELLKFEQDNKQYFSFTASVKEVLSELYITHAGHEGRKQWIEQAAQYYLSIHDPVSASLIWKGEGDKGWDKLLDYLHNETDLNTLPLMQILDQCPPKKLAQYPYLLLAYVKNCLEHKNEAGYSCFEAIMQLPGITFSTEVMTELYEQASEWCEQNGKQQKALEYRLLVKGITSETSGNEHIAAARMNDISDKILTARFLPGRRELQIIASVLLALLSLIYFHIAEPFGELTRQGMDFIGISIAAVMMWIVRIVPDYLVALCMAMLWVLFGVIEPAAALSGFVSTSWLYMLFILALGAVIVKSGLLYRFSLLALKRFPSSYLGQFIGIMASGALLNPLIPSSSGKVGLGVPLAKTLSEAMGYKDRSNGMAGLSLAAMIFYGFTAPFVLTGSYTNMLALSLTGASVNWFQWFVYALPAFLLFGAVMAGFLLWMFRKQDKQKSISVEVLEEQLKLLGGFSRAEAITAWTTIATVVLIMLEPVHGVDFVWIMLLGFLVFVVSGILDEHTLKTAIDWPFLLFIGVAFSFGEVAEKVGVVAAMSDIIGNQLAFFMNTPILFVLAVALLSFVVTLVVRDDAAVILLVVAVAPFAALANVHPWVIVFVILLATDPFFFTYQSPTYLTAYYSTEGKSFSHKQGQLVALAYGVAVLLIAVLCVPYWQWIGLIGN